MGGKFVFLVDDMGILILEEYFVLLIYGSIYFKVRIFNFKI